MMSADLKAKGARSADVSFWHSLSVLSFFSWLLLASSLAYSENLPIGGLTFHIDELTEVDSHAVRITLFGDSRIIPKTRLEPYVVEKYFLRPDTAVRFSVESVVAFFFDALERYRSQEAKAAYLSLLARTDYSREKDSELAQKIRESKNNIEEYKSIVQHDFAASQLKESLYSLVYRIGTEDFSWLQVNGSRYIYSEHSQFAQYLLDWFSTALEAQDFARATTILGLAEKLYEKKDRRIERMSLLLSRAQNAQQAVKEKKLEELYPLIELGKSDPLLARILQPLALQAIHEAAEDELKANRPAQALLILSRIDVEERTPRTHDLVYAAIQKLPPQEVQLIEDIQVEFLVRIIANNDARVQKAYSDYLDRRIRFLLSTGNVRRAEEAFEKLVEVRPDDSVANEALRKEIALTFVSRGYYRKGERLLKHHASALSAWDRLRLFLQGYYVDQDTFFLVLSLIVIVCGLIAFRVRALLRSIDQWDEAQDEEQPWVQPKEITSDQQEELSEGFS
ncbi:MAG: hypothetical protein KDD55_07945, partial [Bdellovibrionales bacterium]|nr:hypothetical protein [Bdellovibrionales bacterium]